MKMRKLACLLVLPATASAAQPVEAVGVGKIAETLLWLGLVLVLILGMARLLQKFQRAPRGGGQGLAVVNALNLGNREKILLVRAADKHILVGATSQSIATLHVFDELPEPSESAVQPQPAVNFSNLVNALQGRTS